MTYNTLLDMVAAAVVVVFIVDLSGFSDTICDVWARLIHVRKVESVRPFTCSLCMTFWVTNIVALADGWLTWQTIVAASLLAFMADTIGNAMRTAKELIELLIHTINHLTLKLWK